MRRIIYTGTVLLSMMVGDALSAKEPSGPSPLQRAIEQAVSSEKRSNKFIAFDQKRRPVEVLKEAGIKPGMTVVDINSSGGYYTEIVAELVGETGKVYAHNGPAYWAFIKKKIPENFSNFSNIISVHEDTELMTQAENTVDVVLNILSYHDYFISHPSNKHEDIGAINQSVLKILKPGGTYLVVDHRGPEGSSDELINAIHRIDPERLKKEIVAAGFTFAGSSDILANPNDTISKSWFGKKPRYNTDRVIFRFIKK